MNLLSKHGPFVKDQIIAQDRLAHKYRDEELRAIRHQQNAASCRALLKDLEQSEQVEIKSSQTVISNGVALLAEDLDGLPKELIDQLVLSETDAIEYDIVNLIRSAGGVLPVNKIMIGLFRKTGVIHQRPPLIARLHRMVGKQRLFTVQDKRGLFSTKLLNAEEARALQEEQEENSTAVASVGNSDTGILATELTKEYSSISAERTPLSSRRRQVQI